MTIEELDPAKGIQIISFKLKEPKEIDWEQRKWELAKEIFAGGFNCAEGEARSWVHHNVEMTAQESIHYAEVFIEEYQKKSNQS